MMGTSMQTNIITAMGTAMGTVTVTIMGTITVTIMVTITGTGTGTVMSIAKIAKNVPRLQRDMTATVYLVLSTLNVALSITKD